MNIIVRIAEKIPNILEKVGNEASIIAPKLDVVSSTSGITQLYPYVPIVIGLVCMACFSLAILNFRRAYSF